MIGSFSSLPEQSGKPWNLLLFYGLFSICTTFLNKQLAVIYSDALVVIFIQNFVGVLVISIFHWKTIQNNKKHYTNNLLLFTFLLAWIYVFLLWTSLLSLGGASITLTVVVKSCLPFCTAIIEPFFFNEYKVLKTYFWLILMVLVSICLVITDPTFTFQTFIFVGLNLFFVSTLSIAERIVVKYYTTITPTEIGNLRNLFSLPINLLIIWFNGVSFTLNAGYTLSFIFLQVLLSSATANGLAIIGFILKAKTTATTIAVAGTASKIFTVVLDRFFYSKNLSIELWIGIIIFSVLILMYSLEESRNKPVKWHRNSNFTDTKEIDL